MPDEFNPNNLQDGDFVVLSEEGRRHAHVPTFAKHNPVELFLGEGSAVIAWNDPAPEAQTLTWTDHLGWPFQAQFGGPSTAIGRFTHSPCARRVTQRRQQYPYLRGWFVTYRLDWFTLYLRPTGNFIAGEED